MAFSARPSRRLLSCRLLRLVVLPSFLLLGACEAKLGADFGVAAPASTITAVRLAIPYVDFEDSDSSVHSFDTQQSDAFDTLQYLYDDDDDNDADTVELFTDDSAKGDYVSVRPRIDVSNASVTTSSGAAYPLTLSAQPDYQNYVLSLDDDDSATLVLTLELPFSLIDQTTTTGDYQLQPVFRIARTDTAGTIEGTIATSIVQATACRNGRTAGTGVAAYLYSGSGITPTDYFRTDTVVNVNQPVASAFVKYSAEDDAYDFTINNVEPGTYTIAWTCQADDESPTADDGLVFKSSEDITVSSSSTSSVSFTD